MFISATIALREHRAILGNLEEIERLSPGLYEMVLQREEQSDSPTVTFEPRSVEDLPFEYDARPFESAASVSMTAALAYDHLLAPWTRLFATPWNAALAHWVHPMRVSRWLFSEQMNPWMLFTGQAADVVRKYRHRADEGNQLLRAERLMEDQIATGIDLLMKQSGSWQQAAFEFDYGGSQDRHGRRRTISPLAGCTEDCACPPGTCECGPANATTSQQAKITDS